MLVHSPFRVAAAMCLVYQVATRRCRDVVACTGLCRRTSSFLQCFHESGLRGRWCVNVEFNCNESLFVIVVLMLSNDWSPARQSEGLTNGNVVK